MKKILMTLMAVLFLFKADAQLINLDLEQWDSTTAGGIYPHGWPDLAYWFHQRVPDAHTGNYALQVNVWYYYTETRAVQSVPFTQRPYTFGGYYKYVNNEIKNQVTNLVTEDTAWAAVYLTRWNTTTMQTDTIGKGRVDLMGSASYSNFVCPISYSSAATPDSITIIADPSLMRESGSYFSTAADGKNSFLTVDDLYLGYWPSSVGSFNTLQCSIAPNPVTADLNISLDISGAYIARITDIAGRVVKVCSFNGSSAKILTPDMLPGLYTVHISEQATGRHTVRNFVKQ